MVDRALVEVGLLGRRGRFGNVGDLGRRVEEEVGDYAVGGGAEEVVLCHVGRFGVWRQK